MTTSYIAHYTADNLKIDRWGKYMLSRTDDNMIKLYDGKYKYLPVYASEIWLYGDSANGKILARVFDDKDQIDKYALLIPPMFKPLREISKEVYDGKFRIAHDTNDKGERTTSIIKESDGMSVGNAYNRWENITDINNGLAIIEISKGIFVLYHLNKVKRAVIGSNYDINELVHVVADLYKYKKKGIIGYYLYNAHTRRDSGTDVHCMPFKDVEKISDTMVKVTFYDNGYDSIEAGFVSVNANRFTDYIGVVKSELHIDEDKRTISFQGWYGDDKDESHVTMDFDGYRVNQKEESSENSKGAITTIYNRQHPNVLDSLNGNTEKGPEVIQETNDDKEITIERCWVYPGNATSVRRNTISFDKSFSTGRLKVGSLVAWVLPADNKFIVGETDPSGFLMSRISVKYQSDLEERLLKTTESIDYKNKCFLKLHNRLQGKLSEIQGLICDSLNSLLEEQNMRRATDNSSSKVSEEVIAEEPIVSQPSQQADSNQKESLLLKEVFLYLKGKGFNLEDIYTSISALFPGFEHRLLDDNSDVRVNNQSLFEEIKKYSKYRDNRNDPEFIKSELKLSSKQIESLQYCMMLNGNTFAEALRSVDNSGKASKIYSEIINCNNLLNDCWRQVGRLVLDEIVQYQMEPTEEYRQEIEQEFSKPRKKHIGKVSIPLKDRSIECSLDDTVSYTIFNQKRITYSTVALKYTKINHNVFLFLDKERADKLDEEGNSIISGIPGEGKTGDQTIGNNINSDLYHQEEKGGRILVFARKNEESCTFFDEFKALKVEENTSAREVKCTFKSLCRFQ